MICYMPVSWLQATTCPVPPPQQPCSAPGHSGLWLLYGVSPSHTSSPFPAAFFSSQHYILFQNPLPSHDVWSTARHRHAPKGSNRSTSLPDLIPYLTSTTKLLVKYLWVFKILSLLKRTTVQSSPSFTLKIGKKPQSPASSPSKLSVKRFAKPRCVSPFPELLVIVAQAPTCWEF